MIKKPPFTGASEIINYSADEIFQKVDLGVLYRGRWKMKSGGDEMLEQLLSDPRIMESMKPQAVYGYFPCRRDASSLIVDNTVSWDFPELKGERLSDFFNTAEQGGDMIPLTAVTIGSELAKLSKDLYDNDDYAEYFLLYGLAAEMTEAVADMVNERIDKELGLKSTRRSFGYPACPDLSYQRALLHLLKAQRIGITLSDANQLIPEFSTTALIIHK